MLLPNDQSNNTGPGVVCFVFQTMYQLYYVFFQAGYEQHSFGILLSNLRDVRQASEMLV